MNTKGFLGRLIGTLISGVILILAAVGGYYLLNLYGVI